MFAFAREAQSGRVSSMHSNQRSLFSREQWRERGRIVCVPNSEAKDVVNYWPGQANGLYVGAWHVFSEDQTMPVQQQEGIAA
jgi:hypothetical protein